MLPTSFPCYWSLPRFVCRLHAVAFNRYRYLRTIRIRFRSLTSNRLLRFIFVLCRFMPNLLALSCIGRTLDPWLPPGVSGSCTLLAVTTSLGFREAPASRGYSRRDETVPCGEAPGQYVIPDVVGVVVGYGRSRSHVICCSGVRKTRFSCREGGQ